MKFGGNILEKDARLDTDDDLGGQWQTLDSTQVTNTEPQMWRLHLGRNNQILRADLSSHFVYPL